MKQWYHRILENTLKTNGLEGLIDKINQEINNID